MPTTVGILTCMSGNYNNIPGLTEPNKTEFLDIFIPTVCAFKICWAWKKFYNLRARFHVSVLKKSKETFKRSVASCFDLLINVPPIFSKKHHFSFLQKRLNFGRVPCPETPTWSYRNMLRLIMYIWQKRIEISALALIDQGPVVQSIVSLPKSIGEDSLWLLVIKKSTAVVFSAENLWGAFELHLLTFFSTKTA